jgi:tripartite-type tricarboxylate transporter receptor subunit TctC
MVVNKLNNEVQKILQVPSVADSLLKQGFDVMGGTPQEFTIFIKKEIEKWTKVVNQAGIQKL